MQTEGKSLASKLVKVMEAVNFIPKNGRNQAQNYAYATDADISDTVRKAMAANRVVMLPRVTSHSVRQIQGRNGEININTVTMDFTFIDADSGESFTVSTVGEGMDSGDKGCYKAQTGATKYALLKAFQIPTGDDPEADEQPAQRTRTARRSEQPAQTTQPTAQSSAAAQTAKGANGKPDFNAFWGEVRKLGKSAEDLKPFVPAGANIATFSQDQLNTLLAKLKGAAA